MWRAFVRARGTATRHRLTSETPIPATIKPCVMQVEAVAEAAVVVAVAVAAGNADIAA